MNFYLLSLFISYRSSGEKVIKYLANSSSEIMSVFLMTSLILRREIWCWSLLGFNELKTFYNHLNFRDHLISFCVETAKMIICKQIWYNVWHWSIFHFYSNPVPLPPPLLLPLKKSTVSYCTNDLVKTILLGGRSRTVDQSHSFFLMPTIWFSQDHKWDGNSFHFYSDSVVIGNEL